MKKKPKIAIFSLTACEGCQVALLDLGEKFFNFLKKVELIDFPLIEEVPFPKPRSRTSSLRGRGEKMKPPSLKGAESPTKIWWGIDISFVEGNPITKDDINLLKKIRKDSKILVALGNCAALGGIPEMKEYQGRERTIRYIYKRLKHISNPEIKEIDNFVKVDFTIPGCPISGEEFLKFSEDLIKEKIPEISQEPVCKECPQKGTQNCFLAQKKICLGQITLAGCQAICPTNESPCRGCRGIFKEAKVEIFLKFLEKIVKKEEIEENLEIFGIKDNIEKILLYRNLNNSNTRPPRT